MPTRKRWSRDELLVALNLYHKLTFGQFHHRHPVIIEAAKKMGRTASSLAMKLSNFASLDPVQKLRGIKGLVGASQQDRLIWDEFYHALSAMAVESEEALARCFKAESAQTVEIIPKVGIRVVRRTPEAGRNVQATTQQRRGQDYFRCAVLNNFDNQCGISGIAVRQLLIASHILPWSTHPKTRLEIRNGICLSRLHDAAFDAGLIAFDDNRRLLLSKSLKQHLGSKAISDNFGIYVGQSLRLSSEGIPPCNEYLAMHRVRHGF